MSFQDVMSDKTISVAVWGIIFILFIFLSVTTSKDLKEKGYLTLSWVNVVISVICLILVIYYLI